MFVSYKACTCIINILTKKKNLAGNPCMHVYVHAEVKCLFILNKRVFPVGYPTGTLFILLPGT